MHGIRFERRSLAVPVYRLGSSIRFPPAGDADETGLLAVGGDLRPERLLRAYMEGIFPWPHEGYPLLWFSPDPRMVLALEDLHVSRRLQRRLRQARFHVSLDLAFDDVVRGCATAPRPYDVGTWITPSMADAYARLHRLGHAHSAETWIDGRLAGGLYGVAVGRTFVGESMFARAPDASKIALVQLVAQLRRMGFELFDAQVHTEHVERLGFREWPRRDYLDALRRGLSFTPAPGNWALDPDLRGRGPGPGEAVERRS
jgi:leucyl/phenylalanyl-tRNA--protein transferase